VENKFIAYVALSYPLWLFAKEGNLFLNAVIITKYIKEHD